MASANDHILLIDDDEGIRDFVSMTLADEGYEVLTAPDGFTALEMIAQRPPSLILLDMRMPMMDGEEFMNAYRHTPGPHAPVIVLTAARNAAESAQQVAADAYLAKPFELHELLDLVSRHSRSQTAAH